MESGARCGVTSAMAVGTADATDACTKLLAASAAGPVRKTSQELVDSIVRSMAGRGSRYGTVRNAGMSVGGTAATACAREGCTKLAAGSAAGPGNAGIP